MNETQYKEICQICDELLLDANASLERVSTTWLHIIRPHPVFLTQYEDIFEKNVKCDWVIKLAKKKISTQLRIIVDLFKGCLYSRKALIGNNNFCGEAHIVFISHLVSLEMVNDKDFYFGSLPEQLAEKGYKVILALIDHTGKLSQPKFENNEIKKNFIKLILPDSTKLSNELKLIKGQLKESYRLKELAIKENRGLKKDIIFRASQEVMTAGTRKALRIHSQVQEILENFKCNTLVTTYEGHSWERIAFSGARAINKDVRCIGYMHAPLFKFQHANTRLLKGNLDPDEIWTVGNSSQAKLSKQMKYQGSINCVGSLKGSYTDNSGWRIENSKSEMILVVPEGIESECILLFELSLTCALADSSIGFIWRLHPLISVNDLRKKIKNFSRLPKNIKISDNTIEEDIKKSKWVLYRGSSAVLQAIISGVVPIYYRLNDEIEIDPLYDFNKDIVENKDDLINVLSCNKINIENMNLLKDHCKNYYKKFNIKEIESSIIKQ